MSPGFIVGRGNSKVEVRDGKPHRIITDLTKFFEVSLTPDPAYAGTNAEIRALRAMVESMEGTQQVLAGAASQLEDGAPSVDAEPGDPTEVPACETCGKSPDGDDACVCAPDEQPAGVVKDIESLAAARRRRLQMMGLTLPKS